MKKIAVLLVSCVLFINCSHQETGVKEPENKLIFEKLLGTWQLSTDDEFEQWTKDSDSSYSSRTFGVDGSDTTIMEKVKIIKDQNNWNFITQVSGQNKGKSITFKSTFIGDTIIQFENPAHDFPRLINYRLVSKNAMQAFIGGATDTIYFNFSRVNTK